MHEITLELVPLGLVYRLPGVIHTVKEKVGLCKIEITSYVWFQTLALLGFRQRLLVLSTFSVNVPQVAGRHHILRIALGPQFVYLAGLLQLPSDALVVQGSDAVFFSFADPVA